VGDGVRVVLNPECAFCAEKRIGHNGAIGQVQDIAAEYKHFDGRHRIYVEYRSPVQDKLAPAFGACYAACELEPVGYDADHGQEEAPTA
jgi:hypothetical protein